MNHSFFRFILVGVFNTCVGLTVMYLFIHLFHTSYWIGTFLGNGVGAIVSYFLNRVFTFQSNTRSLGSVIRFVIVILCCYFVAYYIAEKLAIVVLDAIPLFPISYEKDIAVLFGTGFYTILNYIGQRFFVFKESTVLADKQ